MEVDAGVGSGAAGGVVVSEVLGASGVFGVSGASWGAEAVGMVEEEGVDGVTGVLMAGSLEDGAGGVGVVFSEGEGAALVGANGAEIGLALG